MPRQLVVHSAHPPKGRTRQVSSERSATLPVEGQDEMETIIKGGRIPMNRVKDLEIKERIIFKFVMLQV